jgi:hypothetical protein
MNSLSLFLYLADIVGSIQGIIVALFVPSIVGTFAFFIVMINYCEDHYTGWHERGEKYFKRFLIAAILLSIPLALIPSKLTMYLIASSEIGEDIASDPEVKAVLRDTIELLKQGIKDQLKDDKDAD